MIVSVCIILQKASLNTKKEENELFKIWKVSLTICLQTLVSQTD